MKYLGALILFVLVGGCAIQGTSPKAGQKQAEEQELAKIYTDMGLAYLRRGELERAQERLEKSLSIKADAPDTLHFIAEVYHRLGNTEEAEKHYRKALALKPQEPNLLNNFAAFLCSQGHYAEAEQIFIKVANNPAYTTPYVAYENAGRCALRTGELGVAEDYFTQALRGQPKLPISLFHMAELQHRNGDYFKARAFFERYLEVGGRSPEALLLGYQIETKLGDNQMASRYADQLVNEYRDSAQTARLREMGKVTSQEPVTKE